MIRLPRSDLTAVAVPTEHGGWSLTLEPALLGLLVAYSPAGLALAGAALLAFVARTPLKVVLVDKWRRRRLERTRLATRVFAVEAAVGVGLIAFAISAASAPFWWPLTIAGPLIAVELWHDMRSRGRRLVPELAGSIGVAAIAAVVALADGSAWDVALGLWLVMAARSAAAVPFVRVQLLRFKDRPHRLVASDAAQFIAVLTAVLAWWTGLVPWPAVGAITGLAIFELAAVRRPPQRAAVIGAQQVVLGLTVVLVTSLAVIAP